MDRRTTHSPRFLQEFREVPGEAADGAIVLPGGGGGSWRNVLDSRQVRALVDAHGPVMAWLGYLCEAEAFLGGGPGPRARREGAAPGR